MHALVAAVLLRTAGKALYCNGAHIVVNGRPAVKFTAPKSACLPCPLRSRCLRTPERTAVRQVVFFTGPVAQNRFSGRQGGL